MRYDQPVYFQKYSTPAYNDATGNYADAAPAETLVYASVVSTDIETMRIVYGGIRYGSKTIHLQNAYTDSFDSIRIGDKVYAVDSRIPYAVKEGYVISEVKLCQ